MKKTLSILMSILIIALSFTFMASAAGHPCDNHVVDPEIGCNCCFECPNLNVDYVTSCIKDAAAGGDYVFSKRCCTECRGLIPCNVPGNGQILSPEQQETFIEVFQDVLARVREFFDNFFDMIFEFLRFDEIMGNN